MNIIYSDAQSRIYIVLTDNVQEPILDESENIGLKIWRESDDYFFDFSDSQFKESGWIELEGHPFLELNETTTPGIYYYSFDPAGNADNYGFWVDYSQGDVIARGIDVLTAGGIFDEFRVHKTELNQYFNLVEGVREDVEITLIDDDTLLPISNARIEVWNQAETILYLLAYSNVSG